jgi:hypothetical protein
MDAMERGVTSLKKIYFEILFLILLLDTSTTKPNLVNEAH